LSVVVTQDPTQSFPARHGTVVTAHFFARLYQLVVESLMVSLLMIMSKEFGYSVLQRFLSEENHAFEAVLCQNPVRIENIDIRVISKQASES
jgi:hypothetical protein